MSNVVVKNGGSFFNRGDSLLYRNCDFYAQGSNLVVVAPEPEICVAERFPGDLMLEVFDWAEPFWRRDYNAPYGVFVVEQKACAITLVFQQHCRKWYPNIRLDFSNFKQ